MVLWLILAGLTAAVLFVLLRPLGLGSAGDDAAPVEPRGLAIYQDQLAQIDADVERGAMAADEAADARIELSRRLLASAQTPIAPQATAVRAHNRLALVMIALAPVLAAGLYAGFGSPDSVSKPTIAGSAPTAAQASGAATPPADVPVEQATVEALVAKVEAQLRLNPRDGRGWAVVAPVYAKLGRAPDAAEAYRRAIALLGETPERLRGLAQAVIAAADGRVPVEARAALTKLSAADPNDPQPRFWLALAKEQAGQLSEAAVDYTALLASAPGDAAWRPMVEERLALVSGDLPVGTDIARSKAAGATKGPSADDVAAAQGMTPEARTAMIGQMVDGLAAKLEKDGRDLAGWLKLARARKVLGDDKLAGEALQSARGVFKGDAKSLSEIDAAAKALGLQGAIGSNRPPKS